MRGLIFNRLQILLIIFTFLLSISTAQGRSLYDSDEIITPIQKTAIEIPFVDIGVHDVGRLGLTISNQGSFGTGFVGESAGDAPSGVYPYPGNIKYLFSGSFWIGAVAGRDTLVSVGADGWQYTREMWPDPYPRGEIETHSILNPDDEEAISEQDFIARYTDTLTNPNYVDNDIIDGRPHIPLNIEITQRSYSWSYAYAEDFVLFDYSIKNIGRNQLDKVYMAVYFDAECRRLSGGTPIDEWTDDISGFRRYVEAPMGCGFIDTINAAYVADNDGRHTEDMSCQDGFEMTSIAGIKVVRTPSDILNYSFNWWISNGDASLDFGPRKAEIPDDPFRDFGGFLGTPEGDRNKYYIMRHREFDYDQLFTAMDHTSEGWLPPPADAVNFADGYDTRFLLSFGPFDISPGEVLPVTFAYINAEYFHHDCDAFQRLFRPNPYQPQDYYDQLDFSDFGLNSMWASWIYDNPGYDTDGNGDKGKYRICAYDSTFVLDTIEIEPEIVVETTIVYLDADTLWYEGDGVPDFRGASPPPPPELWDIDTTGDTVRCKITPRIIENNSGELRIRWNGFRSENTKDVFSNSIDFEGYRVYQSFSPRPSDYMILASYDLEDYNKWIWNNNREIWELKDPPFTIDSLRKLYDFLDWNFIQDYLGYDNQFHYMDSVFYFTRQDWNQSDLDDTNLIHKTYPDQLYPSTLNLDSAFIYYPDELTGHGYFKYFEYEYTIRNLLPSRLNYIAVTAFDFGSPKSGLASLETSPGINTVAEYPQNANSIIEEENLDVVVYPNPYRIDGNYRALGFEGLGDEDMIDDRVRAIHFTNLPPQCTIRIFTIDGDLVREIKHDCLYDSPRCMHESWDMITRNTQAPVSGIYYWVVESPIRSQIGKLVLIM